MNGKQRLLLIRHAYATAVKYTMVQMYLTPLPTPPLKEEKEKEKKKILEWRGTRSHMTQPNIN